MVGLVLLVVVFIVVRMGLSGADVSTVKATAKDAAETFPAASLAVAVIECAPLVRAVVGVNVHAPVAKAFVVPSTVIPSSIVMVLRAFADPEITGFELLVNSGRLAMTGASGAAELVVCKT